jgi:hypothetical protein
VEAGGFELCLSFLLGASVGYALRAAISSIRRAKVRKQRREEVDRSAVLDRETVVQEQAGTQYLAASPALAGAAAAIIREIESGIDSPREPAS